MQKIEKIWRLYYDGFRSMTVGRSLWLVILIKLFILFAIVRVLFFPDKLKEDYPDDASRAGAVRTALTQGMTR